MAEFALNPVRFEDIRAGIIQYLKDKNPNAGEFDFDGSNLGYQIDANAYITMLLSYQNVQAANNIFLDTTEIRRNAISLAKPMGYRPKRKISSRFSGTAEYSTDALGGTVFPSNATLTIPAKTTFTSSPKGYKFINTKPITLRYENDVLLSGDFILYEGIFEKLTFFGTGEKLQKHTINSLNVEENNLFVYVKSTNSQNRIQWTYAPSFFTAPEPTVFFIEEDISNQYKPKIIFGDGTLGQIPSINETIEVEYLKSRGLEGNGETSLSIDDTSGITATGINILDVDFANLRFQIPSGQISFGGKDTEDLKEIDFNANRFYSSGGRGVTRNDIISLLTNQSSSLKDYNVIGGNELFPDDHTHRGITYITAVPAALDESNFLTSDNLYLSEVDELELRPPLESPTVISTNRVFTKPTYIYIDMNPFVEVPDTFSASEIEAAIVASLGNLTEYYSAELNGLGNSLKYAQLISTLSTTEGITSADLDMIFHFIINYDSFYNSKVSTFNLPVLLAKDANGRIIYDANNNPTYTNFIKKRQDIIDLENSSRKLNDQYTQFTLPIDKSPVYGSLTSVNSKKELYNIDISEVEFITFEMLGSGDNKVLSFRAVPFVTEDDITYTPNLYESFTDTVKTDWLIQLNGRTIGQLTRDKATNSFSVSGEETDFLINTVGVRSETEDTSELISLLNIDETSEDGITKNYYKLAFLLENKKYTDIRINSKNKIGIANFDVTTYEWTISDPVSYNNGTVNYIDGDLILDELTTILDDNGTENDIFKLKHYNGVFSIDNYNNGFLIDYNQRNDIEIEAEFTLEQDTALKTFEFSQVHSSIDITQVIVFNETKEVELECDSNISEAIAGAYFSILSAEDETEYYIFFDSNGIPAPDRIDPDIVLLTVNDALMSTLSLNGGDLTDASANDIALAIKGVIEADTGGADDDFTVTIDETLANKLIIDWKDTGKSTDPSDGPSTTSRNTGFSISGTSNFATLVSSGGKNETSSIEDISVGDYLKIEDNSNSLTNDNKGLFLVQAIDAVGGTVTVYNRRGIKDINGKGTITHWKLTSGTFGEHTIYSYDLFHNVSLGKLNYVTGNLTFDQTIKGFKDFTNNQILERNIKDIFDEYEASTTKMDKIKIIPIDNYSSSGVYLGQNYNFDGRFNQYIIANITQPIIK